MKKKLQLAVSYIRVSTRRQGDSGLGLEAQQAAVAAYAKASGLSIIQEYRDIESGRHNARPGLAAALEKTKAQNAVLVIAKLDRLARRASFVMALKDAGVNFVACDLPQANPLTIALMAALAEQEADLISTRTRAALAVLKARGVRLGSPRNNLTPAHCKNAAAAKRAAALLYHNGSVRHAKNYRAAGYTLARIAHELNASGARARRGGLFTATQVRRLLALGAS